MDFTAVIRRGEKQYVALCPEVDVVSQGKTIEKALSNLREAVELYVEEMGLPVGFKAKETIIANFEVNVNAKAAGAVGS
jgi:predicted RNase H-like HicB family nuclease